MPMWEHFRLSVPLKNTIDIPLVMRNVRLEVLADVSQFTQDEITEVEDFVALEVVE